MTGNPQVKGGSKRSLVPAQGLTLSLVTTKPAVAAGAGGSICHPGACACERSGVERGSGAWLAA